MSDTAYCTKCKKKVSVKEGKVVSFEGKGGTKRKRLAGKCKICDTKVSKILPNDAKNKS